MTVAETMEGAIDASRPRLGTLLKLAWPMIVARATQAVVGFSDALMTAPVGKTELAAVTTGAIDVMLLVILPMGTVFIVQSFAAQLRGAGRAVDARRYAGYGLALAVAAGLMAAASIPFVDDALRLFPYEDGVRAALGEYLRIRLWSVGAIIGVEALSNWYGGLGNTRVALIAGTTTMCANVALNFALIMPRFGLPGYGVAGAAWASVASSWIALGVLGVFYRLNLGHDLPKARFAFRFDEFRRVLRFGLPNGFNWFLEFGAFALFLNAVVSELGTDVLAAFMVVINVNMISFMPAFGAASAGAILVGEAIGAKRFEQAFAVTRLTLATTAVWMACVGLVYLAAPDALFGLFTPPDEDVSTLLATGTLMLALSAVWQLFDATALTFAEALRAAGDTKWPMMVRLGLAWGVWVPFAYAAVHWYGGGPVVIILSLTGYIGVLSILLLLRFKSGRWRSIEMVGPKEGAVAASEVGRAAHAPDGEAAVG
jgi:multidrug resistance protein, MATE family